jgi:hypothetical protein
MIALAGGIIQPDLYRTWTQTQWAAEYDAMRQVRMNHIVLQWAVNSTASVMRTYYPTKMAGFRQQGTVDAVGRALTGAHQAGLTVWLGLNWTDDWWSKGTLDQAWLDKQFLYAANTARELWSRYSGSFASTIAGFYTPLEIDNTLWATGQTRMGSAWGRLADTVHALGKPLMCAPYFLDGEGAGPQEYADAWGRMAATGRLDVVAMQDGCGTGHCTVDRVPAWFGPLKASLAASAPRTALWADVETCTPSFTSGPLDRVWAQQAAVSPYVTGATTFSFNHYDSPRVAPDLFAQWKTHVGVS